MDILVVDDEKDIRLSIKGILSDENYGVIEAANIEQAAAAVETANPALILLDMWLEKDTDGMKLLGIFRERHPEIPVVVISGHGNVETAVKAIRNGAYDFIEKPFKADHLLMVIERVLEVLRIKKENQELKKSGVDTTLIGKSFYVNNLKQIIVKVASTNSRVLITGPAGSGKEIVARNIHQKSDRRDSPFLTINSANLTFENFEENIFGNKETIGLIERAQKGIVLIDEITDLTLPTQGKLVKFIQDSLTDIRIIATSSRDLKNEIAKGTLREDLYYRLNVVPITTSALKDRREDIDVLCDYFIRQFSGRAIKFTTEAVLALRSYSWPGNIRQLRNVMEWLVIMQSDEIKDLVRPEHLPADILNKAPEMVQKGTDMISFLSLPLKEAKELFEKEYFKAQLGRFDMNISQTARFVDMERSALHRKLKQLGVVKK